MERRILIGDNEDLFKRGIAYAVAPVRRGTRRILAYNIDGNFLKMDYEKTKRRCFRKRVSAKTAVFSVFKSVKLVK